MLFLKVFDKEQKGFLEASEFKKVLPMLGEEKSPQEIEDLFEEVSTSRCF